MKTPAPIFPIAVFLAFAVCIAMGDDAASPERTIAEEEAVLQSGRISARQRSLARLATRPDAAAGDLLKGQFALYRARALPPALWLDLFEAMAKRGVGDLRRLLGEKDAEIGLSINPLKRFEECLEGGDGAQGRTIFEKRPDAGCVRCHAMDGKGGQVGPDLTWLRNSTERSHILEAIILPNSTVAAGFPSMMLTLKNGETLSGIVRAETPDEVSLVSFVDGRRTIVAQTAIERRTPLPTPMPQHFGHVLDKRALRDLVEFIAAGD